MGGAFITGAPQRTRAHRFFRPPRDCQPNDSHLYTRCLLAEPDPLVQCRLRMRMPSWRHCSDRSNERHPDDRSGAPSLERAGSPLGFLPTAPLRSTKTDPCRILSIEGLLATRLIDESIEAPDRGHFANNEDPQRMPLSVFLFLPEADACAPALWCRGLVIPRLTETSIIATASDPPALSG